MVITKVSEALSAAMHQLSESEVDDALGSYLRFITQNNRSLDAAQTNKGGDCRQYCHNIAILHCG